VKRFAFTLLTGFFILALPLGVLAQTKTAPIEILVQGADGETAFTYQANTADPVMRRVPAGILAQRQKNPDEFIRLLAGYITENTVSDFDKVKKAHDWVALNIKYDTKSYFSGIYSSQDSDAVIRRGSAVCAGYADIFRYLCNALEIECITVNGYSRGYGSSLFRSENVTNTTHDWNIVIIEGKKYLIDTTWDAGYVSGKSFIAGYKTAYFLTDPAIFIYDHFPGYSVYQLLDPPLSAEAFANLPFLEPLFFETFETYPEFGKITEITEGDDIKVVFSLKPGNEVSYALLTPAGVKSSRSYFPEKSDVYSISLAKLKPGRHILRLSVRKPGERFFWYCADYGFVVKEKSIEKIEE